MVLGRLPPPAAMAPSGNDEAPYNSRLSLSGSGSPGSSPTRRRVPGPAQQVTSPLVSSNDGSVVEAVVRPKGPARPHRTAKEVLNHTVKDVISVAKSIRTELVFGVWQMWFMLTVVVLLIWSFCWFYLASAWDPMVSWQLYHAASAPLPACGGGRSGCRECMLNYPNSHDATQSAPRHGSCKHGPMSPP